MVTWAGCPKQFHVLVKTGPEHVSVQHSQKADNPVFGHKASRK
jgi:hypothetical protein